MTDGQKLTLLLAARQDRSASTVFRARASLLADNIDEFKEPADGYVNGMFLTAAGKEAVTAIIADKQKELDVLQTFQACFFDVLRRLRARTASCDDVSCLPFEGPLTESPNATSRVGWRISWQGEGWHYFSGLSSLPEAVENRNELFNCARELGLEAVADNAPGMLVLLPEAPMRVFVEALSDAEYSLNQEQLLKTMSAVEQQAYMELSRRDRSGEENLEACRQVYLNIAIEAAAEWRRTRGLPVLESIFWSVDDILLTLE